MAREYMKAVMENTVVEKSTTDLTESCEDFDEWNNSMGLRSPGGPMKGRSVKEYEEQLAGLKKENFNLKLRIYFLEERMGVNFNFDKENIVKKNVELMVEVESLRKEVQEKHDLLCQAVKAMELDDEEHKKVLSEKEEQAAESQQEIENLKVQLLELRTEKDTTTERSSHSSSANFFSTQTLNIEENYNTVQELQKRVALLEEELNREKESSAAVQIILDQNETKINSLQSQLDESLKKLVYREEEMKDMNFRLGELRNKCQGLHKKLESKSQIVDELSCENDEVRKRQALLAVDLEKERKRYEKLKQSSEHKTAELQSKLEAALGELKKSQELVVSKSSTGRRAGHTDADSFSVQKPATPPGSPQKDTFLLPAVPSPVTTPTSSPSPSGVGSGADNPLDLRLVVERLKAERDAQHQKIVKLKAEQMKACKIIKSMIDSRNKTNDEIAGLKQKNEALERELEGVVCKLKKGDKGSDAPSDGNTSNESSMDEQNEELIQHYKTLTDELDEKNRILKETLDEKDNQMKMLKQQHEEILRKIQEKEERVIDLEFELLAATQDRGVKIDGTGGEKNDDFYVTKLKEKDEEIEKLNDKLLRRNCDLQGIVNKELWEKNRQIEKLQKKQQSQMMEGRDHEMEKLRLDLQTKERQLTVIKERICELGIEIDLQDGGSVDNNLHVELEKSEKLRAEANEVCAILSRRLEELAIFLDSLLRQKSVLGFLGSKDNKKLRQIIDQSLDLSRTFTMSMIINPDQSLLQLTNLTSLLNDTTAKTENEDDLESVSQLSLVYKSHMCKKDDADSSQIIQTLRQQIVNLKYELQLRDVELNKMNVCGNVTEASSDKEEDENAKANLNTTSTTLKYKSDNQSESEAWSEPDRSVSRARIGLLEGSLKSNSSRKTITNTSTDSTEDEEADVSSRNSSKKGVLNESRNTIMELHKQVCELDQRVNEREIAYYEVTKANGKLRQEMANLEIKLCDTETKLREAEKKKSEAEERVDELQREKEELLDGFNKKDKKLQNKINEIEHEKTEALEVAKEAETAAEIARDELKLAESKLREMQAELKTEYENQIREKEEESLKKISEIQNITELEIKSLRSTINKIQLEYSENYVKKCELEAAAEEIEGLKSEIETLEERISYAKNEEEQTREKLKESENQVNILRNDLDNATVQYSEVVLEKTKLANEKALAEQELSRSVLKEVDMKKRLDQVENELREMRDNHQKQVSALQMQRSKLEMRVSELESSNAELHNRLIKIQAGCGDHHLSSSSLPNTPNFVNQIVSFRRQHSENSGYLSEDHLLLDDVREGRGFNRLVSNQNLDIERNEANSSPDLGIESDHGRFSSLETHLNVQRPLLQTLELTASMNNLLDVESNYVRPVGCDDAHCCQKTLEMAHENSDLKRKLLRTRRALEETVTQLTLANQKKKQVEKTICRQIHKTSQVLRKAKANLDSGSETDVYKK